MPLVFQMNMLCKNDSTTVSAHLGGHTGLGHGDTRAQLGDTRGGHGKPRLAMSIFHPKTHAWGLCVGQSDGVWAWREVWGWTHWSYLSVKLPPSTCVW